MIAKKPEEDPNVVTLENVGPIERLEIPANPGTIIVLRGPNGAGKSTVLDAVNAITAKRSAGLTSRDGTVGGFAKGFGVTIKVARNGQNRRLGDLEVVSVEDRLDIASLVDPGLKDEAAADLRRIKALCNLVGATVQLDDLYDLVGGREAFEAVVDKKSMAIEDPIQLVEAVKRDFEGAARNATTAATNAHQAAVAKLAENEGIDLDAPHDADILQATLSAAIGKHSTMQAERANWEKAHQRAEDARKQLEAVQQSYTGPSVEAAQQSLSLAETAVTEQRTEIDRLEKQLLVATNRLGQLHAEKKSAEQALQAARSHQQAIDGWSQTISAGTGESPVSFDDLESAATEVKRATAAVETGTRVRDALKRAEDAEKREAEATEHRERADRYRQAAQATLDVLAESVRRVSDRIDFDSNFRLIVKHPQRQQCYFADLSHGERWALALDMVIETARQREEQAVLAIPQEAWEGLDGRNRKLIGDKVHDSDLIVFTAEADRDEDPAAAVTAEVLS
jgi:energy-coupling factor transporter ATP-binding protein EcfA2/uncharacterized coiled-coil protein SlyX